MYKFATQWPLNHWKRLPGWYWGGWATDRPKEKQMMIVCVWVSPTRKRAPIRTLKERLCRESHLVKRRIAAKQESNRTRKPYEGQPNVQKQLRSFPGFKRLNLVLYDILYRGYDLLSYCFTFILSCFVSWTLLCFTVFYLSFHFSLDVC